MTFQQIFKTRCEIYMGLSGFKIIGNPDVDSFIMATRAFPFAAVVGT